MRHLITCMGELLIDFLPIEEAGKTAGFRMFPAGSLLNVAVGIARLDAPAAFAGKVATDFFGRVLRGYAESERIDTRFLLNDTAQSTLAFVAIEDNEPAYSFYGDDAADTRLLPEDLPQAFFDETAILHVGSISLLRGSTPGAVIAACERLKGHALISFDPNIRPGLVHNEAGYRATIDQMLKLADLVKISAADLAWLIPGATPADAAAMLLRHGPALVVVTRGAEGVLALRQGAETPFQVPAFAIILADTIGAGDSFNGGLLSGLLERGVKSREALLQLPAERLQETLRYAAAVAALTCTRPGADPPRREVVEQMLAK